MLNFAICDDNANILEKFPKMLESIFINNGFDASIGIATDDVEKLLNYIEETKTDVLILDIDLKSQKNGLEVASKVRQNNKNTYFIFTTGHLEYAMMAYKFKTFDYLAKPVTYDRLEETIKRLFEDVNGKPKKYLKIDNNKTIINENEIEYIKKDGVKLVFHTKNREYATYSSFNKIMDMLPNNFVRIHKSYIANVENISNIDFTKNTVYFENNESCEIGPKFKRPLFEEMKNNE